MLFTLRVHFVTTLIFRSQFFKEMKSLFFNSVASCTVYDTTFSTFFNRLGGMESVVNAGATYSRTSSTVTSKER